MTWTQGDLAAADSGLADRQEISCRKWGALEAAEQESHLAAADSIWRGDGRLTQEGGGGKAGNNVNVVNVEGGMARLDG